MLPVRLLRIVVTLAGGIVLTVIALKIALDLVDAPVANSFAAAPNQFVNQTSAIMTDPFYRYLHMPVMNLGDTSHSLWLADFLALFVYAGFFSLLLAFLERVTRRLR